MDQPPRPSGSQSSGPGSTPRQPQFEPYASVPSSYAPPASPAQPAARHPTLPPRPAPPAAPAKPAAPVPAAPVEDEIQLEEDEAADEPVSLIEAELEEEPPKTAPQLAPAKPAPQAAPQPAAQAQVAMEPPAQAGEEGAAPFTSKIKAFGVAGEHRKRTWKRLTKADGTGAVRVRTFHGKLSDQGMGFLDDAINDWLDQNPEIEVKFVTSSVGVFEGKIREPALVLNLWY